jgi:hypothetical protein
VKVPGFVEHDGLMVIDEVQLAPWLFRSIKVAVDTCALARRRIRQFDLLYGWPYECTGG